MAASSAPLANADAPDRAEHLARMIPAFEAAFGQRPTHAAAAPGRVNLIGEHTDYNDGLVMPLALERQTLILAALREDRVVRLRSLDVPGEGIFTWDPRPQPAQRPSEAPWWKYVQGAMACMVEAGLEPRGLDVLLSSSVPVGSGLSSSASIEVAAATLLEAVNGRSIDPVQKALHCQTAEHRYAGVPCGIMDQFISAMGQAGSALLIDCRSHTVRPVPLQDPAIVVLIANSNCAHALTGGEYAQRRQQCETAAAALGVRALRDASLTDLLAAEGQLDDLSFRRARHVITEIQRTLEAADALAAGSWDRVGELMYASHASLRDDFEVSTAELDTLVDIAAALGRQNGVIGSRMTGGGFGGCTVSLVQADALASLSAQLHEQYLARTGITPTIFATRPGAGAAPLALPTA